MKTDLALRLFRSAEAAVQYQFPHLPDKQSAEMILDELLRRYGKQMAEEIIESVIEYESNE